MAGPNSPLPMHGPLSYPGTTPGQFSVPAIPLNGYSPFGAGIGYGGMGYYNSAVNGYGSTAIRPTVPIGGGVYNGLNDFAHSVGNIVGPSTKVHTPRNAFPAMGGAMGGMGNVGNAVGGMGAGIPNMAGITGGMGGHTWGKMGGATGGMSRPGYTGVGDMGGASGGLTIGGYTGAGNMGGVSGGLTSGGYTGIGNMGGAYGGTINSYGYTGVGNMGGAYGGMGGYGSGLGGYSIGYGTMGGAYGGMAGYGMPAINMNGMMNGAATQMGGFGPTMSFPVRSRRSTSASRPLIAINNTTTRTAPSAGMAAPASMSDIPPIPASGDLAGTNQLTGIAGYNDLTNDHARRVAFAATHPNSQAAKDYGLQKHGLNANQAHEVAAVTGNAASQDSGLLSWVYNWMGALMDSVASLFQGNPSSPGKFFAERNAMPKAVRTYEELRNRGYEPIADDISGVRPNGKGSYEPLPGKQGVFGREVARQQDEAKMRQADLADAGFTASNAQSQIANGIIDQELKHLYAKPDVRQRVTEYRRKLSETPGKDEEITHFLQDNKTELLAIIDRTINKMSNDGNKDLGNYDYNAHRLELIQDMEKKIRTEHKQRFQKGQAYALAADLSYNPPSNSNQQNPTVQRPSVPFAPSTPKARE